MKKSLLTFMSMVMLASSAVSPLSLVSASSSEPVILDIVNAQSAQEKCVELIERLSQDPLMSHALRKEVTALLLNFSISEADRKSLSQAWTDYVVRQRIASQVAAAEKAKREAARKAAEGKSKRDEEAVPAYLTEFDDTTFEANITTATESLQKQREESDLGMALDLQGEVAVLGDIHGDHLSFKALIPKLQNWLDTEDIAAKNAGGRKVLFLGDVFDRGTSSTNTFDYLLKFYLNNPGRVFILRGNHETANFLESYRYQSSATAMLEEPIRSNESLIKEYFKALPYAAVINNATFASHAGIPSLVNKCTVNGMPSRHVEWRDFFKSKNYSDDWIYALLWPDYVNVYREDKVQYGYGRKLYGSVILKKFFEKANNISYEDRKKLELKHCVFGHQHKLVHYDLDDGRTVDLVVSSPLLSRNSQVLIIKGDAVPMKLMDVELVEEESDEVIELRSSVSLAAKSGLNVSQTEFDLSAFVIPCSRTPKMIEKEVNVMHDSVFTDLQMAVSQGDIETVKVLLAEGADINAKDVKNETALHSAVRKGRADIVELLLNAGADVHVINSYGETALKLAIEKKREDIFELLKESERSTRQLLNAMKGSTIDLEQIKGLLKKGANVNTVDNDEFGSSVLHLAICYNCPEIVKLLLDAGANAKVSDRKRATVLQKAAAQGNEVVAQLLYDKYPDAINESDVHGTTPLQIAAVNGNVNMVKWLIGKGADVNHQMDGGLTALHSVINFGRIKDDRILLDMINVLIESGANVTLKNSAGETALNLAERKLKKLDKEISKNETALNLAKKRYEAVIAVLKEAEKKAAEEVEVASAGEDEREKLSLKLLEAPKQDQIDLNKAKSLRAQGAGINATAKEKVLGAVEPLVEKGAGVTLKNPKGKTTQDMAKNKGYEAILAILKKSKEGVSQGGDGSKKNS